MMNSKISILELFHQKKSKDPNLLNNTNSKEVSIGLLPEKYKLLKIKDNVDLVGLSLPSPHLNL